MASTILAAVQGLCGGVLFLVFHRAFVPDQPEPHANWTALACAGIGLTGALYLSEAGITFVDGTLAMLLLAGIGLLLGAHDERRGNSAATLCVIAGLLFGTSVGLKLTNAVFGVGYLAMILAMPGGVRRKAMLVTGIGLGTAIGFAVSAGWWHYMVYADYRNPVYPFAGNIVSDGPSIADDLSDCRFKPQRWWHLIWYPIRMAFGTHPSLIVAHEIAAEVRFRDPRYLLGLVAAPALVAIGVRDRLKRLHHARLVQSIATFYIVSYLAWMLVFGIARYAIVLELLGGGLFLALLVRLSRPERMLRTIVVVVVAMVLATRPGVWDRTSFAGSWYGGEALRTTVPATYVLTSANAPLAYISALLPGDSRVVRIAGSIPIDPDRGIGRMVRDIIGRSRVLRSVHGSRVPDDDAALRRLGL